MAGRCPTWAVLRRIEKMRAAPVGLRRSAGFSGRHDSRSMVDSCIRGKPMRTGTLVVCGRTEGAVPAEPGRCIRTAMGTKSNLCIANPQADPVHD